MPLGHAVAMMHVYMPGLTVSKVVEMICHTSVSASTVLFKSDLNTC